jgi:hypothetical protein
MAEKHRGSRNLIGTEALVVYSEENDQGGVLFCLASSWAMAQGRCRRGPAWQGGAVQGDRREAGCSRRRWFLLP